MFNVLCIVWLISSLMFLVTENSTKFSAMNIYILCVDNTIALWSNDLCYMPMHPGCSGVS